MDFLSWKYNKTWGKLEVDITSDSGIFAHHRLYHKYYFVCSYGKGRVQIRNMEKLSPSPNYSSSAPKVGTNSELDIKLALFE